MSLELYEHPSKVIGKMKNECILCGGVGSDKSRTALAFYFFQQGGELFGNIAGNNYFPMDALPKVLYIITTVRKREQLEWEGELFPFLLSIHEDVNLYSK